MIISKTPFRVSLFGGGTDYEEFYSKFGSELIGFCLKKYNYISLRKTPSIIPYKTRIAYSKTEVLNNNSDIQHNGVRGVLEYFNIRYGVDINNMSELPAQTGTGSSSSFIVGLLNAIYALKNITPDKRSLAEEAIHIERVLLNEPGGIQDQIWAAYGGLNSITIDTSGDFTVRPLPVSEEFKRQFINRSILIYTGSTRRSFKIASEIGKLKNEDHKKRILSISNQAYESFYDFDINKIGRLLHSTWSAKKKLSKLVSSEHVEKLYANLKESGMIGGKLMGAGGSGFIFGIVKDPKDKANIKKIYRNKYISLDIDELGSQIINY